MRFSDLDLSYDEEFQVIKCLDAALDDYMSGMFRPAKKRETLPNIASGVPKNAGESKIAAKLEEAKTEFEEVTSFFSTPFLDKITANTQVVNFVGGDDSINSAADRTAKILESSPVVTVRATPGSGKTTVFPKALANKGEDVVVVLQNDVIAANVAANDEEVNVYPDRVKEAITDVTYITRHNLFKKAVGPEHELPDAIIVYDEMSDLSVDAATMKCMTDMYSIEKSVFLEGHGAGGNSDKLSNNVVMKEYVKGVDLSSYARVMHIHPSLTALNAAVAASKEDKTRPTYRIGGTFKEAYDTFRSLKHNDKFSLHVLHTYVIGLHVDVDAVVIASTNIITMRVREHGDGRPEVFSRGITQREMFQFASRGGRHGHQCVVFAPKLRSNNVVRDGVNSAELIRRKERIEASFSNMQSRAIVPMNKYVISEEFKSDSLGVISRTVEHGTPSEVANMVSILSDNAGRVGDITIHVVNQDCPNMYERMVNPGMAMRLHPIVIVSANQRPKDYRQVPFYIVPDENVEDVMKLLDTSTHEDMRRRCIMWPPLATVVRMYEQGLNPYYSNTPEFVFNYLYQILCIRNAAIFAAHQETKMRNGRVDYVYPDDYFLGVRDHDKLMSCYSRMVPFFLKNFLPRYKGNFTWCLARPGPRREDLVIRGEMNYVML